MTTIREYAFRAMNRRNIVWIYVFIASCLMWGCMYKTKAWDMMEKAESQMQENPDSSLAILSCIDVENLGGREEKARYALLMSMALDKNYVDTTTFDVLQPAIDYYLDCGTPDEKLRTLYYQGRIYQNAGQDDLAMLSFMSAEDLRNEVTDSVVFAHMLLAQATLYVKQYKMRDFIRKNLEAADIYKAKEMNGHALNSYANALDGYIIEGDKEPADSLIDICKSISDDSKNVHDRITSSLLSYVIEFGTTEEVKDAMSNLSPEELSGSDLLEYVRGFVKCKEYDKAMEYLSIIECLPSLRDSMKYASIKVEIFEKQDKIREAWKTYEGFSAMWEEYKLSQLTHDLLFAEREHRLEKEKLLEIQVRDKFIKCVLSGLLILVALSGGLYYNNRLSKSKRFAAEKENDNLRLQHELLNKEKERVELERDKRVLEASNLLLRHKTLMKEKMLVEKELDSKI